MQVGATVWVNQCQEYLICAEGSDGGAMKSLDMQCIDPYSCVSIDGQYDCVCAEGFIIVDGECISKFYHQTSSITVISI